MLQEHNELVDGFEDFVQDYTKQLDDILKGKAPVEDSTQQPQPEPTQAKKDRTIDYSKFEKISGDDEKGQGKDKKHPPPADLDELRAQAKGFMAKKKYDKAAALYNRILLESPNESVAFLNRALAHLSLRQYSKCISDCDSALSDALPPGKRLTKAQTCKAYWRRGQANEELGHTLPAISDYEKLLPMQEFDMPKHTLQQRINRLASLRACQDTPALEKSENILQFLDRFICGSVEDISREMKVCVADELQSVKSALVSAAAGTGARDEASSSAASGIANRLFESCASEAYFIDKLMQDTLNVPGFVPSVKLVCMVLEAEYTRIAYAAVVLDDWKFDYSRALESDEGYAVMVKLFTTPGCDKLAGLAGQLANKVLQTPVAGISDAQLELLTLILANGKAHVPAPQGLVQKLWAAGGNTAGSGKWLRLLDVLSARQQPDAVLGFPSAHTWSLILAGAVEKRVPGHAEALMSMMSRYMLSGGKKGASVLGREAASIIRSAGRVVSELQGFDSAKRETLFGNTVLVLSELFKIPSLELPETSVLKEIAGGVLERGKRAKNQSARMNAGVCLSCMISRDNELRCLIREGTDGLEFLHSLRK